MTTVARAKDTAAGLGYLHSHKIVHRDLSTRNLLVTMATLPLNS